MLLLRNRFKQIDWELVFFRVFITVVGAWAFLNLFLLADIVYYIKTRHNFW